MSWRCFFGFHLNRIILGEWCFSHQVAGGGDDEFDREQYLHLSVCDRCGHVCAYVTDYYTQSDAWGADFHRDATREEVFAALEQYDKVFLWQNREKIEKLYKLHKDFKA
jgi:hypothetical protein